VLEAPGEEGPLVVECKAGSFGSASTTATQARKLLAISPHAAEVLGRRAGPGFVVYVVPAADVAAMGQTLLDLAVKLEAAGIPPAGAGTLGLDARVDGVYLHRDDVPWPEPARSALQPAVRVIEAHDGESVRPLYLVPFDPGVTQTEDEAAWCRAVLLARVRSHAIAEIGHVLPPDRLVLRMAGLLDDATFGVSRHWRSRGDLDGALKLCLDFVGRALKALRDDLALVERTSAAELELTLHTAEDVARAIRALEQLDPQAQRVDDRGQLVLPLADTAEGTSKGDST